MSRFTPQTTLKTTIVLLAMLTASFVFAQTRPEPPAIDQSGRTAIVDSLAASLDAVYVFPDVATKMNEMMRKNLKDGEYNDYDNTADFASRLTEDLQAVSHDLHLRVGWSAPRPLVDGEEASDEEQQEEWLTQQRKNNWNFREVKMMAGNVAYIRLDGFSPAEYASETAIAAMNFAGYADAIIFDLRTNGGGSPSMIQLLTSYLVEGSVHLNSFYVRETDEIEQYWTRAWVPGPTMYDASVYVLTSGRTFSAAEEFTYNLKNMERATIVGETTGGGAHPVNSVSFPELQISISLPFGRAINPITGTNWEGTGVEPDVAVAADEALDKAYELALAALVDGADEGAVPEAVWALAGLQAASSPVMLSASDMETYAGEYGQRRVWIEDGTLYYARGQNGAMRMIPMGEDLFMFEELDWFRLSFEVTDGKSEAVVGNYNGGRVDRNERSGG